MSLQAVPHQAVTPTKADQQVPPVFSPSSPPPPRNLISITSGAEAQQGKRWTMEDKHVVIDDVWKLIPGDTKLENPKRRSFFAIFDGHGGLNSAVLASKALVEFFVADPLYETGDFAAAFARAFDATDKHILERAVKFRFRDGCTALAVFIDDSTMYLANIGDSEAVVGVRRGLIPVRPKTTANGLLSLAIMRDHEKSAKPFSATLLTVKDMPFDEIDRIKCAGGEVISNRVMGSLAVSRAFGDIEYKTPYNGKAADFVISQPHVKRLELQPEHEVFIFACDGLFDVFSPMEAVDLAWRCRQEGKSANETAVELVKAALKRGSSDNVSCIVLFLLWDAPPVSPSAMFAIPPLPGGGEQPACLAGPGAPQLSSAPPTLFRDYADFIKSELAKSKSPASDERCGSLILPTLSAPLHSSPKLVPAASSLPASTPLVRPISSSPHSPISDSSLDAQSNPALRRFIELSRRSTSDPQIAKDMFRTQIAQAFPVSGPTPSPMRSMRASPGSSILLRRSSIAAAPCLPEVLPPSEKAVP